MKTLLTLLATLSLTLLAGAALAQPFYVAGDFNGWDATTWQMFDDGTNGDLVAGDGIHSLLAPVEFAGRHEWKAATLGWGDSWPHSGNSWLITTADNENVLFTFNVNTVGDGWLADGYWPYTDHSLALTVVGDLQTELGDVGDWSNNGTLLLHDDGVNGDLVAGDGYYTFQGGVLPAGTWYWKLVVNGSWDAIGADGAGVNAANVELVMAADGNVVFVLDSVLGRVYAGADAPVAGDEATWGEIKSFYR